MEVAALGLGINPKEAVSPVAAYIFLYEVLSLKHIE